MSYSVSLRHIPEIRVLAEIQSTGHSHAMLRDFPRTAEQSWSPSGKSAEDPVPMCSNLFRYRCEALGAVQGSCGVDV